MNASRPNGMARLDTAQAPAWDLNGLKTIAAHAGVSERTCQEYMRSASDPLPAYRIGRRLVASSAEVNAWLRRQATPVAAPLRLVAASG